MISGKNIETNQTNFKSEKTGLTEREREAEGETKSEKKTNHISKKGER